MDETDPSASSAEVRPHRRRPRYSGKHPRKFEEKYKEHAPARHADTIAKVIASGKTPAGMHRPIMVTEVLQLLNPKPGETAVDCTLGYGGHAEELLKHLQPGGRLLGLDLDPIELPKTEGRLRALGYGPETFATRRSNYAGLARAMSEAGMNGVDIVLADLGVSSMQLDDPARGFSMKFDGPLDMRMNNQRGETAAALLKRIRTEPLERLLRENADEPHAARLAPGLAGREFKTTKELAVAIRAALPNSNREAQELSVRRVFQALRIAANDEFSGLENLLRVLPQCLKAGGRAAILTFHSGEDRRVKKAFEEAYRSGFYSDYSREIIRPGAAECNQNPRSAPAKLRWAVRAADAVAL